MNSLSAPYRWLAVLAATALGIALAWGVTINDDAMDLLPGKAVRGDLQLLRRLGLVDRVFITLSADPASPASPAVILPQLKASAEKVSSLLEASRMFSSVVHRLPQGYEYEIMGAIQPHLPVLLDPGDLAGLEALTTSTGIAAGLRDSFSLLNGPAGIALKQQIRQDGNKPAIFKKIVPSAGRFLHASEGRFLRKPGWQKLSAHGGKQAAAHRRQQGHGD